MVSWRAADGGDPVGRESFRGKQHTALAGLVWPLFAPIGEGGEIMLTAKGDGLAPASVTLKGVKH